MQQNQNSVISVSLWSIARFLTPSVILSESEGPRKPTCDTPPKTLAYKAALLPSSLILLPSGEESCIVVPC